MSKRTRYNLGAAWYLFRWGIVPAIFCASLGLNVGFGTLGCSSVKGRDTSSTAETYDARTDATTQRSAGSDVRASATTRRVEQADSGRVAASQSSGGRGYLATHTVNVTADREGLHLSVVDHESATTQPSTFSVERTNAGSTVTADGRVDTRATTQATEVTTAAGRSRGNRKASSSVAPTFSGIPSGKFSVDGLEAEQVRSKLAERWVIVLILAGVATFYLLMPTPVGSPLAAVGFYGAAAASLVASNALFLAICGGAILIAILPHLRNSGLLTRLKGQMDDWISDAPAHERAAFSSAVAIAARGREKLLDKIGVEAAHSGKVVPVPAVPDQPVAA